MKKIILIALGMVAILQMQACKPKSSNQVSIPKGDSLKYESLAKAFGNSGGKSFTTMFDQPVDYKLAMDCIKLYRDSGEIHGTVRTESIEFSSPALRDWLIDLDSLTNYTSLRVYPGLYTDAILKKYNKSSKLTNRLTVFFFPYKDDQPATYKNAVPRSADAQTPDPFNLGNVHP